MFMTENDARIRAAAAAGLSNSAAKNSIPNTIIIAAHKQTERRMSSKRVVIVVFQRKRDRAYPCTRVTITQTATLYLGRYNVQSVGVTRCWNKN